MFVKLLKSKLHRGRITDTRLHYPGSIAIDADLMKAVNILPYETVLVADLNNGHRLETYAVPAEAGSGQIVVLGAAAQQIKTNDVVIIFSFVYLSSEDAKTFKPKVAALDHNNKIEKRIS